MQKNNFAISIVLGSSLCLLATGADAQKAEFTFDLSSYYYEEPNFMNDSSDPVFISIGIRNWQTPTELMKPWHFLYTTEATYGEVAYSSTGTGTSDSEYYKLRLEGYAGYKLGNITPFAGLGYRWLYDDGGGRQTTTGAWGYDRESQYLYIPVGGIFNPSEKLRIKGQLNVFVAGQQTSYLSDIAGYSDVENDQGSGWGVDLTADYKINDKWRIYSFYRYWDIGKSEVAVGNYNGVPRFLAWEPANTTQEYGMGVAYAF